MLKAVAILTVVGALGCSANDCTLDTPTPLQQGQAAAFVVRARMASSYAGLAYIELLEYFKGRGPGYYGGSEPGSVLAGFYIGGFNSTWNTEECGVNLPEAGSEGIYFLCGEEFPGAHFGLNDQGPQSGYAPATEENLAVFAGSTWEEYTASIGNPGSRIDRFDIYGCTNVPA